MTTPEEAKQRMREYKRQWNEDHAEELRLKRQMAYNDEVRAKKREDARGRIDRLVQAGVFVKLPPGRKRMYTPEEAVEVAKRQRQESYQRRKERIEAARALLGRSRLENPESHFFRADLA